MEFPKRFSLLIAALILLAAAAGAQSPLELAVGAGSVASGGLEVRGGFWPRVSATLLFNRKLGINADFTPRARGTHLDYVPWIADGNLVYRPLRVSWEPEIDLGVGFGQAFEYAVNSPAAFGAGTQVPIVVGPHLGFAATLDLSQHVFFRPVFDLYLLYPLGHPTYSDYAGLLVGYSFGGR